MDPGQVITLWLQLGKNKNCKAHVILISGRPGVMIFLGQDQDSLGGGFYEKQSWSGQISQFNIWDFALEDYHMENAAECRSDILGNIVPWKEEMWIANDVSKFSVCDFSPLFPRSK